MSIFDYLWSFRYFIYDSFKIFLLDYVITYKNFSSFLFNVFIKTMDRKKALDKIKMSEPYNRYPEIIEEVLEDE